VSKSEIKKAQDHFNKGLKIQGEIGKLIAKLDKLGFEFTFMNYQSSIRRKRK
tara:strand:- start:48 stop:203 length:156 start_codon:yes stop_codon:yes gene_type:complete